mmetsp:Transcript_5545/g.9194  ORF Transcript_5545/g.9194 Transcript_5545/m.9194 type:complete len:213 (-) Transcript_5545:1427-2065(-)
MRRRVITQRNAGGQREMLAARVARVVAVAKVESVATRRPVVAGAARRPVVLTNGHSTRRTSGWRGAAAQRAGLEGIASAWIVGSATLRDVQWMKFCTHLRVKKAQSFAAASVQSGAVAKPKPRMLLAQRLRARARRVGFIVHRLLTPGTSVLPPGVARTVQLPHDLAIPPARGPAHGPARYSPRLQMRLMRLPALQHRLNHLILSAHSSGIV